MTISPTDDAFVRAQDPTGNYGATDYFDSQGGLNTFTCGSEGSRPGAAYAYLKFNLSAIPAGARIDSVDLQLTSRSGFAFDGDPNQHIRFVADDAWTEGGVTFNTSPTGVDSTDLASNFIWYNFPICGDPKGAPQLQSFDTAPLAQKVGAERAGDGTLSLQVFNNNCPVCPTGANRGYWVRFFSKEAATAGVRPQLVVNYSFAPVPELYDAVPGNAATTVVGRIRGGQPATDYTLRFFRSPSCTDGVLDGTPVEFGQLAVHTGADGSAFYSDTVGAVPPAGSFVAAKSDDGTVTSELSRCVPAPDNDTWPRARPITSGADVNQPIDLDGQARWYRIDVQPNSNVTFDLTGLPANYDMYVFKDIGSALTSVTDQDDLEQLSAEFAGEATAPSAFSPSAFSPSAFSPSAFSPSAFSPSAFSPSAFSPSAFSPSAFSPSAFSPSAFSPSAFSPSAFSPSAFSPESYSSAQVRSLLAASLNEGTAAESIKVNSWGNTRLYVMVTGRHGASSVLDDYHLHVSADGSGCEGVTPMGTAPANPTETNLKTLILTDYSRMAAGAEAALSAKLDALKSRPEVTGKVIRLQDSARIASLNLQADQHNPCPYAKNLVAGAIKDVVDSYRHVNPGLKYVVIVGNDHDVPFFRYPDTAGLGPETNYSPPVLDASASQASLRRGYVLSQDAYGSDTEISLKDASFPVPELAVGRLAESPAAIGKVLDGYLGTANGVTVPKSSLVTGYDFLTDAATAVNGEFSAGLGTGTGVRKDTLITDAGVSRTDVGDPPSHSWDADRLRDQLLGSRHDLMFLAGHFNSSEALAADFTTKVTTQQLTDSTADLTNSVVTSAGCHSGYNVPDEDSIPDVTPSLDWAEAFAQKGATLIAGTGYQYGDTDFLEYSERLYLDFAHQLRLGTGAVSIGDALVKAKQQYLADTPLMRGIHQKALLESTLFGLPMLSVNLPAGRITPPGSGSTVSPQAFTTKPGVTLGLQYADLNPLPTPTGTPPGKSLTNLNGGTTIATWLTGPDGVLTNPGEPALPLLRKNVTVQDLVLRGVGFRGGDFSDQPGVTPLTGAATTELQAVHTPFAPSVFFPQRLWSVNYFDALSGGGTTSLSLTPAQYKADGPGSITDVLRRYSNVNLRLYYSGLTATFGPNQPALAGPPAISDVVDSVDGGVVKFRVNVVGDPSAGIQEVWITYHGAHAGKWEPLDLHQDDADSTLWTGSLTLPSGVSPSDLHYVVQAVNGVGVTSLDDNVGRYYTPAGAAESAPTQNTALHLVSPPSGGAYGSDASVTAQLLDADDAPLPGRTISFTVGSTTRTATTAADGKATASLPLTDNPGGYRLAAAFGGDEDRRASSDSADFSIQRQDTALTLTPGSSRLSETEPGPTATLTAGGSPLPAQTILFVLTRADSSIAGQFARLTGADGKARIGIEGVPAGTFTVTVYYGGTVGNVALGDPTPYTTASATASVTVNVFSGFFAPADNRPVVNSATAGRAIPIKFSLGYNAGLSIFGPGFPKITPLACSATAQVDPVETTVSVDSPTLSFDATTGQYTWVWKTTKDYAGSCKRLVLRFTNGADHVADFKFTK